MRALFERHGAAVYRQALRVLNVHELAEHAMQEVFIAVLRGDQRLIAQESELRQLYHITNHTCVLELRNAVQASAQPHAVTTELRASRDRLDPLRLMLALSEAEMAETCAHVLFDGMTLAEISELLDLPREALRARVAAFDDLLEREQDRLRSYAAREEVQEILKSCLSGEPSGCPSHLTIDEWVSGDLTFEDKRALEQHLEGCASCKDRSRNARMGFAALAEVNPQRCFARIEAGRYRGGEGTIKTEGFGGSFVYWIAIGAFAALVMFAWTMLTKK